MCRLPLVVVSAAAIVAVSACDRSVDPPRNEVRADIVLERESEIIEARVPRNATLGGLLRGHEVSDALAHRIVEVTRESFDPRRLRADQPYRIERTFDGLVRTFEYKIDADRFLRVVGLGSHDEPTFEAEVVPYEKQTSLVALRGEITRERSSLVAALNARGENVMLAMAIADVFGGDIDFNNDLQVGDAFEVVFEKRYSEGEFAGYGPVLAAEFQNDGRTLRAIRFEPPGGEPGYYDEQGRSRKRFFLRSPLKFEPRISSGFSYRRLHPVTGQWAAHPAIDYIAPHGSPVIAVAAGTVVRAGYFGAAGNMVTIRHNNGYESSYLHLSSFVKGVRAGVRVTQGEMIGRVGATGRVTGVHLDYRLKKDGKWVNPLVEHRKLPPGEPIAPEYLPYFEASRDRLVARFIGANDRPDTALARRAPATAEVADATN